MALELPLSIELPNIRGGAMGSACSYSSFSLLKSFLVSVVQEGASASLPSPRFLWCAYLLVVHLMKGNNVRNDLYCHCGNVTLINLD